MRCVLQEEITSMGASFSLHVYPTNSPISCGKKIGEFLFLYKPFIEVYIQDYWHLISPWNHFHLQEVALTSPIASRKSRAVFVWFGEVEDFDLWDGVTSKDWSNLGGKLGKQTKAIGVVLHLCILIFIPVHINGA